MAQRRAHEPVIVARQIANQVGWGARELIQTSESAAELEKLQVQVQIQVQMLR